MSISERTPIDPALRQLLDEQAASTPDYTGVGDLERARMARAFAIQSLQRRGSIPGLPNRVQTRDVPLGSTLRARLYTPPNARMNLPVLVYLHGGGWVTGSTDTHDPFCRLLCDGAGILIASIDYRLAPEDRYPAALEDTLAAVHWAVDHAAEFGADRHRIAVGGDSAGAGLAAVAANRLVSKGSSNLLSAQLLLYPVVDHPSAGHSSYQENARNYGLEADTMRWFWKQYVPHPPFNDPDHSPLQISFVPQLPPTLVATAEYDVLRDEGFAYADKLSATGVDVTRLHASDMHHNFPVSSSTVARFPQCTFALSAMTEWLKAKLH